jgi:hypothetical protein
MARILGAVASSHTPTIGFALDTHKEHDPEWAPIFEGYKPVQRWLADTQPDVLLIIFNDHVTSFFFDHYSHFALGIGDSYAPADEGGGARALPPVRGHTGLSHHIAAGLVADEFDLAYFQDKPLDHGWFSPLSMLWPHEPSWPGAIVPLQIGVLEFPIPSARRCYKLGQRLRKAIENYPEDLKVVLVATGGLSHQVHGERCGFNNTTQLAGIEKLSGTYPFTLARSVKGYRLNKFLHALIDPAWRDKFRVDQESLFETAALSEDERRLVRTLDWRGMIHYASASSCWRSLAPSSACRTSTSTPPCAVKRSSSF